MLEEYKPTLEYILNYTEEHKEDITENQYLIIMEFVKQSFLLYERFDNTIFKTEKEKQNASFKYNEIYFNALNASVFKIFNKKQKQEIKDVIYNHGECDRSRVLNERYDKIHA